MWLDAAEVGVVAEYGEEEVGVAYGGEVGVAGHGGEEVVAEASVVGGIDENGAPEEAGSCTVVVHGVELGAEEGVYAGCKSVAEEEGVGGCSSMADTGEVDDRVRGPA